MLKWSIPATALLVAVLGGGFVANKTLQGQDAAPAGNGHLSREVVSYREIVKKVLPAVVSIEARAKPKVKKTTTPNRRPQNFDDPRVPEEFRKFFEEFGGRMPVPGLPEETPSYGFGSGFIIDAKGVILTNYHVVGGADQVEVTLKDGRKFTSKDVKGDRKSDLAIVRIEADKPLPYLELGDSEAMEIGDRVLAVGAPFGLTGTVTHGIVSAKGRYDMHMNLYEDFVQTDAAINPGNSGGPLVNLDGKDIGINAAIKSRSGGWQGVGLAVSSNLAKNVMQQLLQNGVVHRGYLGVQIKNLEPEVAARLGVQGEKGVLVGQVFENSPAAKGGVQAGDVIVEVNGKEIKNGRELQTTVAGLPLKKASDVKVVRDGKTVDLKVTVEEQPDEFGVARTPTEPEERRPTRKESVNLDKLGVEVTDLTSEMADTLGYKDKAEGAVITRVDPDTPAADAGLQRGMLITKVDKQPVKSASAFRDVVDKSKLDKGVLLQVQSPRGGTDYVMLKAPQSSATK